MLAQGKVIMHKSFPYARCINTSQPSDLIAYLFSKESDNNIMLDLIFADLIGEGSLLPNSKALCIDTPTGEDVLALKEIGVVDSVGIFKKPSPPLIIQGEGRKHPFPGDSFDFEFSGKGGFFEEFVKPAEFAGEICRTLQPEGFLEVHTTARDSYIFNSFLELFNCCELIGTR
ncbi:uncharacterized protein [Medicago truncatula]|uniref:uncharacterized protein n=1 Tax=Medicago truncatula TaxID=3880 RepID=UPI0019689870|nr:uncharacterized protein LOC120579326 [Medicago truncatula]